jgi:ATP-dependent protease HslVU (ClpYQ) peptidase subunit|tara:strand:+ start:2301 stop:4127 length:1827 start_codon:yes stop_codon:yes gene_type:complete
MNFLEGLGYIAQGAIEKDNEIRKEKLQARMEELKENRALYREIAKTRYATDLATYQEESKNAKKIEAVLANIKKDNPHIDVATMALIKADDKTYADYLATDIKKRDDFALNFQNTYFKTDENGYSVNYPTLGLNMPKESDYFKGSDFWQKYSEEIQSNTSGPLTAQVKKLLGKEPDATGVVKEDLNVKGTNLYSDLSTSGDASSTNTEKTNFVAGSGQTFFYDLDNKEEEVIFNSITKSFEKMLTPSTKDKTVARYLVAKGGDYTENENGTITVTGDGANYFNDASNLYEEFAKKIENNIKYAGNVISGKHDVYANSRTVNSLFETALDNRTIKLKNTSLLGGGEINSNYIIPTSIIGAELALGQVGEDGPIVPVFLNNNPDLLKRIEDRVNNDKVFSTFKGTTSQAKTMINAIIQDEINLMTEEGLLGGEIQGGDKSTTGSKGTITSMSQINALMQQDENKGMTSAEIIQGLKEDGYDVSAVEKIKDVGGDASVAEDISFQESQPEIIFDVTKVPSRVREIPGGKGIQPNPEYNEYWNNLSDDDVANFYKAYEKLQSMKPEQFLPGTGTKKQKERARKTNPEYTKWLERIKPYEDWLETFESFQLKG